MIRLTHLYLYAKYLLLEDTISRTDVYAILDSVGVRDSNTSTYLSQDNGISSDEHETLRLNHDGRQQAQQYILDVFNSDLPDDWLPGSDARPAPTRIKKSSKKNSEQRNSVATDVARWVSHEVTKTLIDKVSHSTVEAMSTQDQALLALYGIYKAGTEHEVSVTSMEKYLYNAFEVQVAAQAISMTFYKSRKGKASKTSFVNFVPEHGYKITPSGREHIEELLKLKQPKIAPTEVSAGSNGAVQQ